MTNSIMAIDPGPNIRESTKTCRGCGLALPRERFSRCADRHDGLLSRCKDCQHQYYLNNKEKVIARTKAFRSTPEGKQKERDWQRNRRRDHPAVRMIQEARTRAAKKGMAFDITCADIDFPILCPVLGIPMVRSGLPRADTAPSLDRIDTTKGYVRGNVVVISWRANRIKSDATLDELEAIVRFCRQRLVGRPVQ